MFNDNTNSIKLSSGSQILIKDNLIFLAGNDNAFGIHLTGVANVIANSNIIMYVSGTTDLNNGGNPVVIRLYQLNSEVNFNRVTLEKFWENDQAILDNELIGNPVEVVLYPEEEIILKEVEIKDETRYFAAAANFYNPNLNYWRDIYDLSTDNIDVLLIAVGKDKVSIANPKK